MTRLDDHAVVRRIGSDKTHVAFIHEAWRAHFIKDYWAPTGGVTAACGVDIPTTSVIMATGTTTRCRACVHLTGMAVQPASVQERLAS